MLDSDTTLREKIRILFKEQGITIASVLAAISLAISTLVSLVVAAVRGASTAALKSRLHCLLWAWICPHLSKLQFYILLSLLCVKFA